MLLLVGLLFIANSINIGVNLSAMGTSAELTTGLPSMPASIAFAVVSLVPPMFVPYHRYAVCLKWLTMVPVSDVAVLFLLKIDWLEAAKGFVMPLLELDGDTFTVIVAILGTPDARFRRLHCDGSSRGDDNLSAMLSQRCDFATDESSGPIAVTTCLRYIVQRHL
ncbi:divalent metal cation transporter [Shinella curvata]|uniref:Divalent metal cation transporter n=1 Tax=Shinella curvata TaxID=1817964 RepID=A0ABT8XMT8_9HYPH|nr:divalent metal cation transporter [Shinella curvata]MCJ8057276.1 divalent metal cation transporter [Shinella curvata]MDO6125056.1 divalent metal cation transporter [Shinella curvata]